MADTVAYPQLIPGPYHGGAWTVGECDAIDSRTAPERREFHVPRPRLAEDVLVQLHELYHVKRAAEIPASVWRDRTVRGAIRRTLEEPAIDSLALRDGLDIRSARDHLDWAALPPPGSVPALVERYIRLVMGVDSGGVNNPAIAQHLETVADWLRREAPDLLALAWDAASSVWADPSPMNCEAWADKLGRHPKMVSADPACMPTPSGDACEHRNDGLPQESDDSAQQRASVTADEQGAAESAKRAALGAGDGDCLAETVSRTTEYGRILVHRHLTTRQASSPIASDWRAVEGGTMVRFPRLFVPSGRVFGARARGGSILIDLSGSMRWTTAALEAAIYTLPGVWVGGYSAHPDVMRAWQRTRRDDPQTSGYRARLCILAAGGRLGEYQEEQGEHTYINEGLACDAPALAYAYRRAPHPLVWVSDGETGSAAHARLCDSLLRRWKIVRVRTIPDAVAYLVGRAVKGWRQCDDTPHVTLHK